MLAILMVSVWLTGQVGIPQQHVTEPMLEVSGPTWSSDGKLRGAAAGFALKAGQPIDIYQASGRNLCLSASAVRTVPSDAGYGWHVRVTPVSVTVPMVMDVEWERRWDRGVAISNGPRGKSRMTLDAGEKVVLDYVAAGGSHPDCLAVGMGLQLAVLTPASDLKQAPLYEAQLWVVRSTGNATLDRQSVRVPVGSFVEFVFKDMRISLVDARAGTAAKLPPMEHIARTRGRFMLRHVKGDSAVFFLDIEQYGVEASADRLTAGGHGMVLQIKIGEVVELPAPRLADRDGRLGERLAFRIQIQPISRTP